MYVFHKTRPHCPRISADHLRLKANTHTRSLLFFLFVRVWDVWLLCMFHKTCDRCLRISVGGEKAPLSCIIRGPAWVSCGSPPLKPTQCHSLSAIRSRPLKVTQGRSRRLGHSKPPKATQSQSEPFSATHPGLDWPCFFWSGVVAQSGSFKLIPGCTSSSV